MMNRLFNLIVLLILLTTSVALANKKPTVAEQAAQDNFTETYYQKKAAGGKEYSDWLGNLTSQGTNEENEMFKNLEENKTAGGAKKSKAELAADKARLDEMKTWFMGDKTDHGPSDWSDWEIETDANGHVKGFKEKDLDKKDADGDGKISDEERKNWNDKVAKDNKDNGGAPGDKDITPDWDKDGDGKPDAGFALACWRCNQGQKPQCQDGLPGPCGAGACDAGMQCTDHAETFETVSLMCHNCQATEKIINACTDKGYSADASCDGKCPPIACVPLDIDKDSGKIVPSMQTRAKDTTMKCYGCMNIKNIIVEYIVLIVETPYERFILAKGESASGFKPSSVMALAKVDPSGKIKNAAGDLKSVNSFLGGMNVGSGMFGLPSTGTLGMSQLTGMLGAGLNKSGSYGSNCFDEAVDQSDKKAEEKKEPTSKSLHGKGKNPTPEQIKASEDSGSPAVSGPVVACGNEGKNKVLKVYDAGGALVGTITQAMLKANPSIITEKLGIAQQWSDQLIAKSGFDFASYVEKFTGLPLKQMQQVSAQIAQAQAVADQALTQGRKKKSKKPEEVVLPNDPLYKVSDAKKSSQKRIVNTKKRLAGLNNPSGFNPVLADPFDEKHDEASLLPDQYALHKIGYTPLSDPNSAWNVVDATSKNIVVAVIDSGLDLSHEDAPEYIWTNPKEIPGNGIDDDEDGFIDDVHGWNFVSENHDFTDIRGHGTFVAGIIAAKQNNAKGITGINPGAVIMPLKVTDDEGQTNNWNIYRAINFAVNHGARVVNLSLGGKTISQLEQQAIERAHALGVVVVTAAGNTNDDMMTFGPSSSKGTIAVGETNASGERSTASNWGANLGLVAPGERVWSLCSKDNKHVLPSIRKKGYYQMDGTSFTAPMVAATASLMLAKEPTLTNDQVSDILRATATDQGDKGWDGMTGAGVLNAQAALRATDKAPYVVMITNIRLNRDLKDRVVSVDVFGTVTGDIKEYTLEAGKGKLASKFTKVAGPFKDNVRYAHLARLVIQEVLRGSDQLILRIRVVDASGQEHIASTLLSLSK